MKINRALPLLCAVLLLCSCSSAAESSSSESFFDTYDPYTDESWQGIPYMEWFPRPETEPVGAKANWEITGKTVDTESLNSMAITNDGSVWAWGQNGQYQAGTGYNSFQTKPVKVLEDAVTVEVGSNHNAAIRTDGSLWIWGGNNFGQSGTGSEELTLLYPQKSMDNISRICPQTNTVVVIDKEQQLWEWGVNHRGGIIGIIGQELQKIEQTYETAPQKKLDQVLTAVSLDAQVTALRADGGLWSWGYNESGESGSFPKVVDGAYATYVLKPTQIAKNMIWHDVALMSASYAIDRNRDLWIWGHFSRSKRGDTTNYDSGDYFAPEFVLGEVEKVYNGRAHVLVIKEDGSLWAWGNNAKGQLGAGPQEFEVWPPVKVMDNVRAVSAHSDLSFAITEDDVLWGWGANEHGDLGIGNNENQSTPVKVMEGVNSVYQTESGGYTLVLKQDGTLWSFGMNYVGQLGDGTREERNAPVKILDDVRLPQPEPDWESRIWPEETSSTAETTE